MFSLSAKNLRWSSPLGSLCLCALLAASCFGQLNTGTPVEMQGVEIEQKIGAQIPLDARFVDELGRGVTLGDYFNGRKPVVLVMNYYKCPMLCGLLLNHLVDRLGELHRESKWTPGEQFDVVAVSFEPLEGASLAASKKESFLLEFGDRAASAGLHFLTGEKDQIQRLMQSIGYSARWNSERQEWIHPSAVVIGTPRGIVSRYLDGLAYDAPTLRLSLVQASEGKKGSIWDQIFLTCYIYVPHEGRYVPYAMGIMRLGGGLTVVILGITLISLWRWESARRKRLNLPGPGMPSAA